jgi:F-type H+-transporting ATPase subunit b
LLKWFALPVLCLGLTAPAALAEEGGEQVMLFRDADIGNFVISLVIFALVIVGLGRLGWKPLLKVLNDRARMIRDSLESARREREEARRLLAEYQARLDQAREEAAAIVEEGRRDGEAVRRRIHEEARQQAAEMIERARREIRLATDAAIKELYDQTAELAVNLAGGIIRKELSPEDHRRLIAESLDRMRSTDLEGVPQ